LFSQDPVANFVNDQFEPVWESVRPVPIVRIDFGNGNVLTRTLHGNILTSVCTPEGNVLDALPGIYTQEAYLDRLDQLKLMARQVAEMTPPQRAGWLQAYHRRAALALAQNQPPERFAAQLLRLPVGKGVIENPVERLVGGPGQGQGANQFAVNQPYIPYNVAPVFPGNPYVPSQAGLAGLADAGPKLPGTTTEDLKGWQALAEDTRLNENTRRRQIHELLAASGQVQPGRVLKPIYKDVLHADLDDPYLGLGKTLFDDYPFAKEDQKH